MTELAQLESDILGQIAAASDEAALETVRVAALGKKGSISALLSTLGKMSPDERKTQGAAINLAKDTVTRALTARRDARRPRKRAGFIRSARCSKRSTRFSPTWDSPSPKVPTSRPTITISPS